jgi:hypothetical protein
MPLYGDRTFSLVILARFRLRAERSAFMVYRLFQREFGQLGTQFDALGHTG